MMACKSGAIISGSLKMLSVVTGSVELINAPNNIALFNEKPYETPRTPHKYTKTPVEIALVSEPRKAKTEMASAF